MPPVPAPDSDDCRLMEPKVPAVADMPPLTLMLPLPEPSPVVAMLTDCPAADLMDVAAAVPALFQTTALPAVIVADASPVLFNVTAPVVPAVNVDAVVKALMLELPVPFAPPDVLS